MRILAPTMVEEMAAAITAVEQAVAAFGGLDGLINNAGGMVRRVPYADVSEQDYDEIMDLNARSVVVASQAAVAPLKAAGGGFIINTTSVNADTPSPDLLAYATTKGAIQNFTGGLAQMLAEKGIHTLGEAREAAQKTYYARIKY